MPQMKLWYAKGIRPAATGHRRRTGRRRMAAMPVSQARLRHGDPQKLLQQAATAGRSLDERSELQEPA
jgi:hypothetical protein